MCGILYGDAIDLFNADRFDYLVFDFIGTEGGDIYKRLTDKYDTYDMSSNNKKVGNINTYNINNSGYGIITSFIYTNDPSMDEYDVYKNIRKCLRQINKKFDGRRIGITKMVGTDTTPLSWTHLKNIINTELYNCDVTVIIPK